MMLLDQKHGILFTGDTFYEAALYAHFDCPEFGRSDLKDYLGSMEKIHSRICDIKALYCSHNDLIVGPEKISEAVEAFRHILDGKAGAGMNVDLQHQYLEDGTAIVEYPFAGFSIVCRL
jgi:glyoxylase-like metal-dependent hydrolase (beta-lactamase superfamily II)